MDPTIKRIYYFLIILGVGLLLFIVAFATPIIVNGSDFSIFNPGWNGCSDIAIKTYETGKLLPTFSFEDNELMLAHRSFADYNLDPSNSTIIIIGPRSVFTELEGEYIADFLEYGGMVLLADDFGTGNDLLEKVNASSRFSGDLLLDLSFEKNASFVAVFDFLNMSHLLVSNVSHVLLNYPTSIAAGENATVLAVSSEMSWLDANLDGKEDVDEPSGPFPVLVTEQIGRGELVLFSGPSLLINSMRGQLDNSRFRDDLFRYLYSDRDVVIIDESHRVVSMPFHLSYVFPSTIGLWIKIAIVLFVIFLFFVGFTRIPQYLMAKLLGFVSRSREVPREVSFESMVGEVLERHPSWSRRRLEDIVRKVEMK